MDDEEPRISLDLTPRQAAIIYDFVLICNWNRGSYCKELRNLHEALSDVGGAFALIEPLLYNKDGSEIEINDIIVD
jgi:hypothetical protein